MIDADETAGVSDDATFYENHANDVHSVGEENAPKVGRDIRIRSLLKEQIEQCRLSMKNLPMKFY